MELYGQRNLGIFKGCDFLIFASDLDRTLIYSNNFLGPELNNTIIVEKKDDAALSHMTNKSIDLLNLISERLIFIPTTTRSLEQFNRINIFRDRIYTKYAVVANGGIILKNNSIDLNWTKLIQDRMRKIPPPKDLINQFQFFFKSEDINSYRCCDNLFLYAVLKTNTANEENYLKLEQLSNKIGYTVIKNGRKIYIIPSFLNKWEPVKYIMNLENEKNLICAGDSMLDLPMLINSNYGVIPIHGELHELYKNVIEKMEHLHFTNQTGITSSDEFLEDILKLIS